MKNQIPLETSELTNKWNSHTSSPVVILFATSFCQCNTCMACRLQSRFHLSTNQWFIYICLSFNILWSNNLVVYQLTSPVPCNIWCEGHTGVRDTLWVRMTFSLYSEINKLQRAFHAHVSLHKAHFCISLWNSMPCVKPFGGVYLQNVYSKAKLHHLTKMNKGNLQNITSKTVLNV